MNMRFTRAGGWAGIAAATALLSTTAAAQNRTIDIRSNTVVPIVMEDELNFKNARQGDRFFARVDENRDLPYNTRFEGRVVRVQRARDDRPAHMDVEFHTLILPNGTRQRISAVPISLNDRYVSRDRDGRLVARRDNIKKDQYVIGGAIGGLVLGSILKKPFEGAVVGAIAGIIVAETQKNNSDVALRRGSKLGALFERDARFAYNGRWDDRYNDPYNRDDRRDGRYDDWRNDDYRRDDDWRRDDYRYDDRYSSVYVEYRNRELRFSNNEQPYRIGSTTMVPASSAARQMGLDYRTSGRTIIISDGRDELRLEQDSDEYRLNGRRGRLPERVTRRGNVIYVPIEALATLTRDSVYVNGNRVRNIA